MVPVVILYLHLIALTAAFTSEYQKEGLGAGLLTVGFFVLIFSVGWSISSFALRYLIGETGFGMWLDRDALSLVVLTAAEGLFYYFHLKETGNGKKAS